MPFTWFLMWIVALSLMGVPPFSGFWSKDEVLLSCWQSGQFILFVIACVTVAITCFYTVRFMGIIFHEKRNEDESEAHGKEASEVMLVPYGILAALTVAFGLIGPWVGDFLRETFGKYFTESLSLVAGGDGITSINSASNASSTLLSVFPPIVSVLMLIVGGFPAYILYVSHKNAPESIISKHIGLQWLHRFFWKRWYIDAFYNRVFVNGALSMRSPIVRYVERPVNYALNVGVPNFFSAANKGLRKVQTGILSVNILYVMTFLVVAVLVFLLSGVL